MPAYFAFLEMREARLSLCDGYLRGVGSTPQFALGPLVDDRKITRELQIVKRVRAGQLVNGYE